MPKYRQQLRGKKVCDFRLAATKGQESEEPNMWSKRPVDSATVKPFKETLDC